MNSFNSRRGQTEIFGLVIAVLLLSLLLVLVLTYVIQTRGTSIRQEYVDQQLSLQMLGAILTTTPQDCTGLLMSDVVTDAFKRTPSLRCGGLPSSEVINSSVTSILGSTLDVWGVDYVLYMYRADQSANNAPYKWSNTDDYCLTASDVQASFYFLPVEGSQVYLRLGVCSY